MPTCEPEWALPKIKNSRCETLSEGVEKCGNSWAIYLALIYHKSGRRKSHRDVKKAHKQGLLKKDNYSLIQMVQHPDFFATDKRFQPIMDKVEGIAYESHQFNRHWPRETGWGNPGKIIQGAKWTLGQGKEYIFYYGPIIWKEDREKYYDFVE